MYPYFRRKPGIPHPISTTKVSETLQTELQELLTYNLIRRTKITGMVTTIGN